MNGSNVSESEKYLIMGYEISISSESVTWEEASVLRRVLVIKS